MNKIFDHRHSQEKRRMPDKKYPPTLRGQAFINDQFIITNPKDLAYGQEPFPRTCSHCFFRCKAKDIDCMISDKSAHKTFGVPKDEIVPEEVDGVPVGYYCRHFTSYLAE